MPRCGSDEPLHRGDELFARVVSVVGGAFLLNARVQREPTSLAQARVLAGRSGGLSISGCVDRKRKAARGRGRVSRRLERMGAIEAAAAGAELAHEFVEVPTDAELRGFLPPILLERASVHKLRAEEDVRAIACGDVDGDGALDIVLATDKRLTLGHARGHRFVADMSVQIAISRNARATPVPRAARVARNHECATKNLGRIHRRGRVRARRVARADEIIEKMAVSFDGARRFGCATLDPDLGSLIGALSACDDAPEKSTREIASPAAHYDGYAWAAIVSRSGAFEENVTAVTRARRKIAPHQGRRIDARRRRRRRDRARRFGSRRHGGSRELTRRDRRCDHDPKLGRRGLRPRFRVAAPGGVRALAICPPEDRDAPFVAAVVGSEVWLVR